MGKVGGECCCRCTRVNVLLHVVDASLHAVDVSLHVVNALLHVVNASSPLTHGVCD
jgi:hypothetical protein